MNRSPKCDSQEERAIVMRFTWIAHLVFLVAAEILAAFILVLATPHASAQFVFDNQLQRMMLARPTQWGSLHRSHRKHELAAYRQGPHR
jgi:hypothetical protein